MSSIVPVSDRARGAQASPSRRGPGRPTLSNEELLDTAMELFLENGFERTSIDAIAARAGMAKRTIYSRYEDKTTLFRAAIARAIEDWIVPVERLRAAETDDLDETLRAVGLILVENVLGPAGLRLMRLTNAESLHMPEISTFSVRQGTEPTVAYLADLLTRRVGCGREQALEAAQAFINLVVGGPASNAAWGMAIAPEEVGPHVERSVHLYLHGLLGGGDSGSRSETEGLRALLDGAASQIDKARKRLG